MSPAPTPTNALEQQLLDFAVSGRVEHRVDSPVGESADEFYEVLTLATGATTVGVGFGVLLARSGSLTTPTTLIGLGLIVVGLAVLLPALGNVLRHPMPFGVTPLPGSVVPGEMIRVGNWILHGTVWVRVEQVGFGNDGYTALLSTGEVIELDAQRVTAGGKFGLGSDNAASLGR